MMEIRESVVEDLLRDPVMAGEIFFPWARLDAFQRARLRIFWFVPEKVDSSGWGTGKTMVEWIYANLRAMLIPDNDVGVYYPIFQTGKDQFWREYYGRDQSDLFRAQFKVLPGKRNGESLDPGCWTREFKNGSKVALPAPGFTTDANNQASRSFNTLILGEYTQSAAKGEGIDEMIGRLRGPNFSKRHPMWCNHILFSAHAEDPGHPAFQYYKAARDTSRGGGSVKDAVRTVTISFSHRDWTKEFEHVKDDDMIARAKRMLSKEDQLRRLDGIWIVGGKGWYTDFHFKSASREWALPESHRTDPRMVYSLGVDVAPGQRDKADECAFTIDGGMEVGADDPRGMMEGSDGSMWAVWPVYSRVLKDLSADQISGFIYFLDMLFGLSRVVMDPGGGGLWVYKAMLKEDQLISNEMQKVVPICSRYEMNQTDKRPILEFFKRGGVMANLWNRHFQQSDEGIIEAAHRDLRGDLMMGAQAWTPALDRLPMDVRRGLNGRQVDSLKSLARVRAQLEGLRVKADRGGNPILSKHGFMTFTSGARLKKDAAYSMMYAHTGMKLIVSGVAEADGESGGARKGGVVY